MLRTRTVPFALAALALVLAATPALADCDYDFNFTHTAGGDALVSVTVDCGFNEVYRTNLSVFPAGGFVWGWGGYAQIVFEDPAGSQLYCANALSTYWDGMYLAIGEGDSECAYL